MNAAENLASRKLVVAALAILAIAVCPRMGWALSDQDVKAITDIAMTAIGGQACVDLASRALPVATAWLSGRAPAATSEETKP